MTEPHSATKNPLPVDQDEPAVPRDKVIKVPEDPRRPVPGHGVHNPSAFRFPGHGASSRLGSGNSAN